MVELFITGYLALAIAKTLLVYSSLPVAVGTLHRRAFSASPIFWALILVILLPAVCFISLIPMLFRERLRFFLIYPKRRVIKDIVQNIQ